jgi:hypothetical protein
LQQQQQQQQIAPKQKTKRIQTNKQNSFTPNSGGQTPSHQTREEEEGGKNEEI